MGELPHMTVDAYSHVVYLQSTLTPTAARKCFLKSATINGLTSPRRASSTSRRPVPQRQSFGSGTAAVSSQSSSMGKSAIYSGGFGTHFAAANSSSATNAPADADSKLLRLHTCFSTFAI